MRSRRGGFDDDDDEEWEDADEGSVDGDVDDDFPELFAGIRPDSEFSAVLIADHEERADAP